MKLLDIPSEIILCCIIPNIGFNGIVLLTKTTKKLHSIKSSVYNSFITNDQFMINYVKRFKVNLLNLIFKSSFYYKHFDYVYECIKYNNSNIFKDIIMNNEIIIHDKTDQLSINNTFKIFQLFKLSIL